MRATTWARWATCALAISISFPALADTRHAHTSVGDCTVADQEDKGDDGVELTIRNACTVPVDCSISWQLVCAPDAPKRRSVHPGKTKFSLAEGGVQTAAASPAVCRGDSWSLQAINWACTPNKD